MKNAGKEPFVKVGRGSIAYFGKQPVEGVVKEVETLEDIVALTEGEVDGKVLLVKKAGVTGLIPILPTIKAIICTTGGVGSHLAILTREFGIPCVVGVKLDPGMTYDGRRIRISSQDGFGEVALRKEGQ
ncbi:MAG: PEP-utilizing enzyme [Thaumarchaeota archaeon]|nr:PEP-utilizing enzyme [Nitrososphaerota archaeon]MCL5318886.1 PEP-utilizing enzyme [Nitrososphaerota archaeon]